MQTPKQFCISVIIPFYNAESHIKTCLNSFLKQDFNNKFEIILINDASIDNSVSLIKKYNIPDLQLLSLEKNSGPGAARNFGLKMAKGDYIYFHDIDDTVDSNILTILYNAAIKKDCDLVFSDRRFIENSRNQNNNIFFYPEDKNLKNSDIIEEMKKRFYDPLMLLGIFDFSGRLIRRKIIIENKVFFEENLRYLEDETFIWNILSYVKNVIYIRKKLCSFFVHPNVNTALSEGLNRGFNFANFKIIKKNIENCLERRGISSFQIKKIGDQAFIFYIISALVSYSRSMLLGKVDKEKSLNIRKKLINDIILDQDVAKAIKTYVRSKKESFLIPRSITWRSSMLLEFACNRRAKEILRIRRKKGERN